MPSKRHNFCPVPLIAKGLRQSPGCRAPTWPRERRARANCRDARPSLKTEKEIKTKFWNMYESVWIMSLAEPVLGKSALGCIPVLEIIVPCMKMRLSSIESSQQATRLASTKATVPLESPVQWFKGIKTHSNTVRSECTFCIPLHRFASLCIASHRFALLRIALHRFAIFVCCAF